MEKKTESSTASKISCKLTGGIYHFALSKFPDTLQIETTNACNSKCLICPRSKMQRKVAYMDDNLFEKIIEEIAGYRLRSVHLHNFGEPLLDKNLAKRVRFAKQKGLNRVKIFSNGSLINADKAEALIDAGLDEIKISFDGATKEEFEKIRYPLNFDKVISNITNLVELRNRKGSNLKIEIACCSTTNKSETMAILEDIVDKFSFGRIHNWTDEGNSDEKRTTIRKPCSRVFRTFTVLSNGDIALCCLDYDGKIVLGNVREKSIFNIWHSSIYKKMRLYHKNAQQYHIDICDRCSKSFW